MSDKTVDRSDLEAPAAPKRSKPSATNRWLILMQVITTVAIAVSLVANHIERRDRQQRIAHLEEELKRIEECVQKQERAIDRRNGNGNSRHE